MGVQKARGHIVKRGYTARDIAKLIEHFGKERVGELNIQEFFDVFASMGIHLSDDRVTELFEEIDTDHSGTISAREFVHELFPNAYHDALICKPRSRMPSISMMDGAIMNVLHSLSSSK